MKLLVTGGAYGIADTVPIMEDTLQRLINPYGRSTGADPAGGLGDDHTPETRLIPLVLEAMVGRRPGVQVNGGDFPPNGTCIRAYIHVCDLADAHVLDVARRETPPGAGDNCQPCLGLAPWGQLPSAALVFFYCFMRV